MRRATLKALYEVHSWVGLFLGLVLYVLLFSGSVSLFVKELRPWEMGRPGVALDVRAQALDTAVDNALMQAQGAGDFSVTPASRFRPWIVVELHAPDEGAHAVQYFDAATGERVEVHQDNVTLVLTRLHTDLLLPSPWGRYLTGLLGVVMLVSLLTGVFMHRKLFREMWSLRLWRSRRLRWADLHKAAAIWGLPFHLMIAFTGAFLGLIGLVLMLNAFVAYDGDVDAATAALGGGVTPVPGGAAPMRPLRELLDASASALPGLQPEYISFSHYGDRAATLQVWGALPQTLVYFPQVTLSVASADVLAISNWREEYWVRALYGAMTPLHYASYGGLLLKALYALLGLAACFLVISGLRIWQLRVHPHSTDVRLPLIVGVCYGLPLAVATMLLASRLLTGAAWTSYEARLGLLLAVWVAAIACAVRFHWRSWAYCLATGIALMLVPLATIVGGSTGLLDLLQSAPPSSQVSSPVIAELVFNLLGVVIVLLSLATRRFGTDTGRLL